MPILADLQAAGWNAVEVHCRGCRYVTIFPFNSRWARPNDTLRGLAGRLVCSRCHVRPELADVKAYFITVPQGPCRPAPPDRTPSAADE